MKKLLLILAVTFAGITSISYANSSTNISSEISTQPTCPTYCDAGTASLHSDRLCDNWVFDAKLWKSDKYYYVEYKGYKYKASLEGNYASGPRYQVYIGGTTYYFNL